jgi:hypothetical protein
VIKALLLLLSCSVFLGACPKAWAQGVAASSAEERRYAEREAESAKVQAFVGGGHNGAEVVLKVLFFFVYIWILLIEACAQDSCEKDSSPPPAPSPRE